MSFIGLRPMNALRSHCCKPFVPSVTLLRLLYYFALFCVSLDTRVCSCRLSGMLCIPWPRMSCISRFTNLIFKILIQYSVFKVQRYCKQYLIRMNAIMRRKLAFISIMKFVRIACLHSTEQLRCEVHCTGTMGLSGHYLQNEGFPLNGLKWTRTTDLTLIRRAL